MTVFDIDMIIMIVVIIIFLW